ncbi:MAG TPA: zinc ABC transporter substrate-binding protein [Rhodopila sp.]|jgi:zinc/manganese transport system substrate-binding protein|nr:zinc ABC transporter substrate-binding protein [Rhodopila sp.]
MHRRHLLGVALLAAIASKPSGAVEAARLPVIATFSILGDMVATVGGSRVAVRTLVGPDQDVHIYEPTPKDLRDLVASAAVIENGLGLEGWMARLTGAAGFKGRIIQAAAQVTPRTMKEDSGAIATDPHAWQNPRNGVLYVQAIAAGLSAADPGHAAAYADAAQHYADAIRQVDARIEAAFAPIPPDQRRIITTHDAFGYYGARYGIEFLAAEGISTESEPSAKAIAALVQQIKREKIHAVFIENMTGDRMARMLARETGAVLGGTVYSDALSPPGGPAATYLTMLDHNTHLFAAAMKRS